MDPIAKVLPTVSRGETPKLSMLAPAASRAISMSSVEPLAEPLLRRLWQRMAEVYGHRWVSAYGDDAGAGAGQTWAKGLAGLSAVQIADGLTAALASADEWPPTLPRFRAMCFGLPSFPAVRAEVNARNTRRSPFAVLVWSHVDAARYRMADADKADRLLREAYDLATEHVVRGGALPEPREELAAPEPEPRAPASDECVRANLDAIRNAFECRAGCE